MHLKDINIDKVGKAIFENIYNGLADDYFNENDFINCFTPMIFSGDDKYKSIYEYPEDSDLIKDIASVASDRQEAGNLFYDHIPFACPWEEAFYDGVIKAYPQLEKEATERFNNEICNYDDAEYENLMDKCIDKSVEFAITPIQTLAKKVLEKYKDIHKNRNFYNNQIKELFINKLYNPIAKLLPLAEELTNAITNNDINKYLEKSKEAILLLNIIFTSIEELKTRLKQSKAASSRKSRLRRLANQNHFTIEEMYYAGLVNTVKHMISDCKHAQTSLEKAAISNAIDELDHMTMWGKRLYNDLVKIKNHILEHKK